MILYSPANHAHNAFTMVHAVVNNVSSATVLLNCTKYQLPRVLPSNEHCNNHFIFLSHRWHSRAVLSSLDFCPFCAATLQRSIISTLVRPPFSCSPLRATTFLDPSPTHGKAVGGNRGENHEGGARVAPWRFHIRGPEGFTFECDTFAFLHIRQGKRTRLPFIVFFKWISHERGNVNRPIYMRTKNHNAYNNHFHYLAP